MSPISHMDELNQKQLQLLHSQKLLVPRTICLLFPLTNHKATILPKGLGLGLEKKVIGTILGCSQLVYGPMGIL